MPYRTPMEQRDGAAMIYDSGDYPESQRRALAASGWADFPARQEAACREGRFLGIGLANYVEATGRGPFESATHHRPVGQDHRHHRRDRAGPRAIEARANGSLGAGSAPHAMWVAGDTEATPLGMGAFASRQTVTAGNAIYLAARELRRKAFDAACDLLEAASDDLELADGSVRVKGAPQMAAASALSPARWAARRVRCPPGLRRASRLSAISSPRR